MAIVKCKNLTVKNNAQGWKDFFDSFNSSIISTSISGEILNVTVDNDLIIQFDDFSGTWFYIRVYRNGTQLTSKPMESGSDGKQELTIAASADMFYLQLKDRFPHYFSVVYENVASTNLYGYYYDASSRIPITAMTLYDVNSVETYTHGNVLNYACGIGTLNYLPNDIIYSGSSKYALDSNFIACSTVTLNTMITFNGKNYYSVGTHTLIPMEN